MVETVATESPSRQEWEENRESIIKLYKATTATQVQKVMLDRGFKATLQMFKSKFRKWGVSKYMKASEKDRYIKAIRTSGHHASPSSDHPDIGVDELRKIARHLKLQHRDRSRGARKESYRGKAAQATQALTKPTNNDGAFNRQLDGATIRKPSSYAACQFHFQNPVLHANLYRSGSIHRSENGHIDMYNLIRSVETACTLYFPGPISDTGQSFWTQIKHAIYLFRIGSNTRAWSALHEACDRAEKALQTTPVLEFMMETLATLSPSNTRSCWQIRQKVTEYLSSLARIDLGDQHPINVMLVQLARDSRTRDISERGLLAISNLCGSSRDKAKRAVALDARLSTCRLLRKDEEYDRALTVASQAYGSALDTFGSRSRLALSALRQKEHILIDVGKPREALEICFSILNETGFDVHSNSDQQPFGHVIHTMEDIAYIYENLGDEQSRKFWLQRAASSAETLWGESVATAHIMDKLHGTVS
ncbi:hypothetical protein SCUP515_12746 [Seiridium cupressi]